ncbi:hypothetical protein [Anditalea andensis]|uniref:Uncharacterized protein n=1 Tax=Anditalea andensis TaxID=1048983 RepID=A0A074L6R7_9BACT|nr:hypothetical protein [Anditalea andensis]KEO75523.1 hypothetical protein EL17_01355 [Anditalea andensis]
MNNDHKNTPSPQGKSNPSDPGTEDKAAIKEGRSKEALEKEEALKDKYLEEDGSIPPHLEEGTNRNPDKTKNSEPTYGGTKSK